MCNPSPIFQDHTAFHGIAALFLCFLDSPETVDVGVAPVAGVPDVTRIFTCNHSKWVSSCPKVTTHQAKY